MEANELRIKNLVYHKDGNIYYEIWCVDLYMCDINIDDYQGDITICNVPYKNIKPIPLTEEWLLKFGFKKYKYSLNFKIKANKYWSLGELKQGYLKIKLIKTSKWRVENFGNKSVFLYSVHQLQNLYFALTGEELKIKE